MKNIAFANLNPIINLCFFVLAIIFAMIFWHPAYLLVSLIFSITFYISIVGKDAFKLLGIMVPVFIITSLINPLTNTNGDTILFTYFGRNFTFEGLIFGMIFATILLIMILWFASYNKLMTSDKFIYIFGPVAPSLSLIFTMVLRFVPNYGKKAKQIKTARACIGKDDNVAVLSSLTTWAFENGLTTAESMKSRGYGCGKRSNFSIYRFDAQDILLTILMLILGTVIGFCSIKGGTNIEVLPSINMTGFSNQYFIIGIISYSILLSIPTLLNLKEVLTWQILKSKI